MAQSEDHVPICVEVYDDERPALVRPQPARKMWNRAFFKEMLVKDGKIVRIQHEEPFAALLGSHKSSLVDLARGCVNRLRLLEKLRDSA